MMRTLAFVMVFLGLVPSSAAQGGDYYSVLGLGDHRRQIGALYDGMAGTSIAMPMMHGINLTNPALAGMSPLTRLQVGYRFDQHQVSNASRSIDQNNGGVDGIMALFGVDTALGIGITFGLEPFTSVDYSVTKNLRTYVDGDTIIAASLRRGQGGISSIVFGASARVFGRLFAGFTVRSLVGTITMDDDVIALGQGNYDAEQRTSHDLRGMIASGGLYWEVTPSIGIGAFVSGGSDASVRTTNQARGIRPGSVSYDSTQTKAFTTTLPFSYGLGASWRSGRTQLGADVEAADYTGMTVNVPSAVSFGNSFRASLGATYLGSRVAGATFGERVGYSAGLSFERSSFTVRGQPLTEAAVAIGTNFPLGSAAMVDVGVNIGQRTSDAEGALQDLFGRLVVTVSIGEQWFRPFARD